MAPKTRLSVYLDPDIMQSLAAYAARREQSRSLIAEAAIASFLSPDAAERQEAVVTRRLDQFDRRMQRLERDLGIAVEAMAVFVGFWLTSTPALPEPAQAAARAKAPNAMMPSSPRSATVSPKDRPCDRRSRKIWCARQTQGQWPTGNEYLRGSRGRAALADQPAPTQLDVRVNVSVGSGVPTI